MISGIQNKRQVFAWAFYDWANSAFATVVIAGFFPVFFNEFWSTGGETTQTTFRLGVANSIASLIVLVMAPVLGAIADQGALKKRFLTILALLGIISTAWLGGIGEGLWLYAATVYVIATIGFSGANVLYDALLVDVAPRNRLDTVSGIGFSLGYLGGGVLFSLCVVMSLRPGWFGLSDAAQAVRASFVLTAVWGAVHRSRCRVHPAAVVVRGREENRLSRFLLIVLPRHRTAGPDVQEYQQVQTCSGVPGGLLAVH